MIQCLVCGKLFHPKTIERICSAECRAIRVRMYKSRQRDKECVEGYESAKDTNNLDKDIKESMVSIQAERIRREQAEITRKGYRPDKICAFAFDMIGHIPDRKKKRAVYVNC